MIRLHLWEFSFCGLVATIALSALAQSPTPGQRPQAPSLRAPVAPPASIIFPHPNDCPLSIAALPEIFSPSARIECHVLFSIAPVFCEFAVLE